MDNRAAVARHKETAMRIPRHFLGSVVALAPLVAAATAQAGPPADPICGDHKIFVDRLSENFDEHPASIGLGTDGNVIEVFRSDTGSWTLLVTKPGGVSCVIGAGEAWQRIGPDKAAADGQAS